MSTKEALITEEALPELKKKIPHFSPGDTLKVSIKIVEGEKKRIQHFEGTVIRQRGEGIRKTFTLRRISYGVGVEKTFPLYSPSIQKIEVTRQGKVRRAKLYYLRERKGKAATIKEKRD
ncbi:MAG: 50S ribosomal protein L19 [bacterium]